MGKIKENKLIMKIGLGSLVFTVVTDLGSETVAGCLPFLFRAEMAVEGRSFGIKSHKSI